MLVTQCLLCCGDKGGNDLLSVSVCLEVGQNGEVLIIHNVTRHCGQDYQCMAYNDVEPPAFKVIKVNVEFAPEIYLPNKRIGQKRGMETILECTVTAFPHAMSFWQKDGERIATSRPKYRLDVYLEGDNRLTLSLRLFDIEDSDYGPYTCVASNKIGEDSETMILYNYDKKIATTTTTMTPLLAPTSPSVVVPITPRDLWSSHEEEYSDFKAKDGKRVHGNADSPTHLDSKPESHYATQHPRYTPQDPDTVRIMLGRNKDKNSANLPAARNLVVMFLMMMPICIL
ncbi:opioid-binding protein/cell adhesion molecule homolog [Elysia marginata]|uniref:Opioid-binding protein/cell adhesion molecule homolog n=1 Tax=Elysia marginata TaxID=1093978 RepID=A0AAV4HFK7_9GAST|nr:opioid-binding protein/cell adhesion molecule homolog [Elysia marginata]